MRYAQATPTPLPQSYALTTLAVAINYAMVIYSKKPSGQEPEG
jgi:hypothetical protein